MPLVRFPVRNEYGLGHPELYKDANKEDPKAVLDGVTVAGLVGILRQLGDLAEFAAEVFHGLQEQVMATASRSHKLMVRVQCIEAALPPLEKAVLAQTSHIHFAYTAGSEWHPRIRNEQNHFVYNDLPQFIMDTCEECRNPPRLHLLDKFDSGGPGSCLKRYSDPTFFRRVSGSSIGVSAEKTQRDKKDRKKKKKSSQRNGEISRIASISNHSGRMHLTSPTAVGRISTQTASTIDMTLRSDLGDHSNSFDARTGSGYIERVFSPASTLQPDQQSSKDTSSRLVQGIDTHDSVFCDEPTGMVDERRHSSSPGQHAPSSSCVSWDEKAEIVEPKGPQYHSRDVPEVSANSEIDRQDGQTANHGIVDQMDILLDRASQEVLSANFDVDRQDRGTTNLKSSDQMNIFPAPQDTQKSFSDGNQADEIESEPDNYVDALNTIESESENDLDCQTKREVEQYSSSVNNCRMDDGIHEILAHNSNQCPSDIEYHTVSGISASNGMASNLPKSVSSESIFHELTPQISGRSSVSDLSPGIVHEQAPQISGRSSDSDHSMNIVHEQTPQISGRSSDSDHSPGIVIEQTPQISGRSSVSDLSPGIVHEQTPQISGKCSDSDLSPDIVLEQTPQISGKCSDSDHSPGIVLEQTSQISGKSCDSYLSPGTDICASDDILDGSEVEPVINDGLKEECVTSDPSFSGSRTSDLHDQSGDRIISSFNESQQSHAESHSSPSVKFWTNGGLLGLQPSKPPDFAMYNATSEDDVSRNKFGPTNTTLKDDDQKEKINTLVESVESSKKVPGSNIHKVPVPLADSDSNLDKCSDSHGSNRFNHAHGDGVNVSALAASGADLASHVKATCTEASRDNDHNSSIVFGLSHRLLVNGFYRKLSLVPNNKSQSVSSLETGAIDQERGDHHDAYQMISQMTLMDQFGSGSPLVSLTSSPPLEHMKISFNPVDGFETSTLKLKFPEGNQCTGSTRDTFPSFQLVPEPAIPLHHYASDSDDDTFGRSSPYMSDDCASHHSESNSEQWESSPGGSNGNELYDALCRMSSMESVSSSLQVEGAAKKAMHVDHGLESICTHNGAEPSLSCLDLPSFDAIYPVVQGEIKPDSGTNNLPVLPHPAEHTPLPPPLPPVQWRVSKPQLDEAEDKQYAISDARMHALEQKLLGSNLPQQPQPAPPGQQFTNKEAVAFRRESKEDQQKSHENREIIQSANGKGMDEKDFLHQIRTKSFSLRPTVTVRPTFSSAPSANVKVTAILEKANAIRQAVASDDGEDEDNWSDT